MDFRPMTVDRQPCRPYRNDGPEVVQSQGRTSEVRYKWRRTLVRFVVLTLDAIWKEWTPLKAKQADPTDAAPRSRTQVHDGQRSRRVA